MNDKKLKIEITENKTGGEIHSYHLMLAHGQSGFSGLPVYNSNEMRQIATALIAKANEVDGTEKNMDKFLEEVRKAGLKELANAIIRNWFSEEILIAEVETCDFYCNKKGWKKDA
jgi:hypothetical protein